MNTKTINQVIAFILVFILTTVVALAQNGEEKIIEVCPTLGTEISAVEKDQYHILPLYRSDEFVSAQFIQLTDNSVVVRAILTDGSSLQRKSSMEEVEWIYAHIENKRNEK